MVFSISAIYWILNNIKSKIYMKSILINKYLKNICFHVNMKRVICGGNKILKEIKINSNLKTLRLTHIYYNIRYTYIYVSMLICHYATYNYYTIYSLKMKELYTTISPNTKSSITYLILSAREMFTINCRLYIYDDFTFGHNIG